jgi:ABC-type bacteriocin/lantibiotic exporter with double-glycine peptidase domain
LPAKLKGRFPKAERLFFFLAALVFLSACAAAPPPQESSPAKIIAGVPFFPQEMYQCGPASLAGVLNYWGIAETPEEIARAIYSPGARGTLDLDLVFYGEKRGLKAAQYSGTREDVSKNIEGRVPLIVLVDEGVLTYKKYHFMIVVGFNDRGIFAHSGREKERFYPWLAFLKTWEKTKNWTLRLTAK